MYPEAQAAAELAMSKGGATDAQRVAAERDAARAEPTTAQTERDAARTELTTAQTERDAAYADATAAGRRLEIITKRYHELEQAGAQANDR